MSLSHQSNKDRSTLKASPLIPQVVDIADFFQTTVEELRALLMKILHGGSTASITNLNYEYELT